MIDLLDEVVLPAFTDDSLERKYGEARYFFLDVETLDLGTRRQTEPAIVGTFVKDTTLHREQIYDPQNKAIRRDPRTLKTSPSATFVFLLVNHKLLYLHETVDAPRSTPFAPRFINF